MSEHISMSEFLVLIFLFWHFNWDFIVIKENNFFLFTPWTGLSFLIQLRYNVKISMTGRLNLSCLPFVTELVVNNCCLLVCAVVFLALLSVVICLSRRLRWSLLGQMTELVLHPRFPVGISATECIPLLDCGLVLVDFSPYNLIIQHTFLRSSSASNCIQCSGPLLSFSSPSVTCCWAVYLTNTSLTVASATQVAADVRTEWWILLCALTILFTAIFSFPLLLSTVQQIRSWPVQTYARSLCKVCLLWLRCLSAFCCLANPNSLSSDFLTLNTRDCCKRNQYIKLVNLLVLLCATLV